MRQLRRALQERSGLATLLTPVEQLQGWAWAPQ
jgi:hypothetical protein